MGPLRINTGRIGYYADLVTPQGNKSVFLTEAEKDAYQKDPDEFAARHFGLELAEYREWMARQGAPLCAAKTQEGGLCGQMVGSSQVDPLAWKELHRKARCHMHTYGRSELARSG